MVMRHPWQTWLLFGLCLAMVLPAMVWLTCKALQLDRADAAARQQADLEEAVGSALWEMDAQLTRLLSAEIGRPASFYRSFYAAPGNPGGQQLASPLLVQSSPYVRLHFEFRADGSWSSPQCPQPSDYELAFANSATPENIRRSERWLHELSAAVGYDQLLARLPDETLQVDLLRQPMWAGNSALLAEPERSKIVKNALDFDAVQQQLETVHDAASELGSPRPPGSPQEPSADQLRSQRVQSRRGNELQSRDANLQAAAQQAMWDQRLNARHLMLEGPDREGISQPLWLGSRLLLARRVTFGGQTRIQGCWLDWPKIRDALLERISPWLPDAELEPVADLRQARYNRVLATLPAQLVVPELPVVLNPRSPLRVALLAAWAFLVLATLAIAVLMRGVVALSERRAAFVSAVTHELRTPLTTFRMYAEMLAEGMVSEPARQREYLTTLKVEADRLSHLVENVLQFARLERGSQSRRRETVEVSGLLERVVPRLQERTAQAEMQLDVQASEQSRAARMPTDPAAVEQILFNLVDNACKYAAGGPDRRIHCNVSAQDGHVCFLVCDHGPGIAAREAKTLFRPFTKSARAAADSAPGVGLGLALCRRLAGELGGRLELVGSSGQGAAFQLSLPRSAESASADAGAAGGN